MSVTHTLEKTRPQHSAFPASGPSPQALVFEAISKALRTVGGGYDRDQGTASRHQPLLSVSDPRR